MNGYIYLDKKIFEWEWWHDINTYRLFTYMILKANWKATRFLGSEIPRGSFVTSLQHLSIDTDLTINEVRTALKHLETTGEITRKTTNKYTLITVNKYNDYQKKREDKPQAEPQTEYTPKSHAGTQSINKPLTTIESIESNKENIIPPLPPTGERAVTVHNYDANTNLENVKYFLNHCEYEHVDYLKEHKELWEHIKEWMEYKDHRKPRTHNHYVDEKSIKKLLTQFVNCSKEYGDLIVKKLVDMAITGSYQGIVWDKAQRLLESDKKANADWSNIK